jgi:cytochrome oxidase Cu insertion factor (SCO1/SenC/PrrC family)
LSAVSSLRRQRLALVGLALLFLAPLLLAFYAYYGLHWHPGKRVNHGELIEPPRPIPALSLPRVNAAEPQGAAGAPASSTELFRGKWTFLYFGPGTCPAACRADLFNTRQVRALVREDDRVQRVFIAQGECCDHEFLHVQHPDLITLRATDAAAPLLDVLKLGTSDDPLAAGRVYLIDPLGNLMMWYAPSAAPKGMLDDLKRLLGLSHIG